MKLYLLSLIMLYLSQFGNSLGDSIKFSGLGIGEKLDNLWHYVKYSIDRPLLFIAGMLSHDVLMPFLRQVFNSGDVWHKDISFIIYTMFLVLSFFFWEFSYRLCKKVLRKLYE